MNDLIRVSDRHIGTGTVPAVDARELHAFLEVGKDFSNWIKARIEQYGFSDQSDFVCFEADGTLRQNGRKVMGRPTIEYAVSLDMAKELAMVERNERGKQARQYFIEMEARAKEAAANAPKDIHTALSDPAHLRGILLDYTEKVIALEAVVKEQAPKVKFHDAVVEAINCQSVQEAAKVLGTGPNRLFQFLRNESVLMTNNLPYQSHIDAGHFRVVTKQYNDTRGESHVYTRTLVTGKGLTFIQKRMAASSALAAELFSAPQVGRPN